MALVELSPREQEELLWKIKHSKDANEFIEVCIFIGAGLYLIIV